MKTLLIATSIVFSSSLFANANTQCQEILKFEDEIVRVSDDNRISKENWKQWNVIVDFPRDRCHDSLSQEIISVNGKKYWRYQTAWDRCDGGNSYGAIYSIDGKTPIAHIYDSDVYCSESWRPKDIATNHRCDLEAEKLAAKKVNEFGLDFTPTTSSLNYRDGYMYSTISVVGTLKNEKEAEVKVDWEHGAEGCNLVNVKITNLRL